MMRKLFPIFTVLVALACSKPDAAATVDSTKPDSTSPPIADSLAMHPDSTGATPSAVVREVETTLSRMHGVSGDSLKALIPGQRQAAANMIASFNKQMRDMNMTADAAWSAVTDSLRTDLRTLPDLTGPELQARIPAHEARLKRLIQMHQTMMKNMKM
jgi:hypothetical protein